MRALPISTSINEPPSAGASEPARRATEGPPTVGPASAGPAAEAQVMSAARVRGHAVARKRTSVSPPATAGAEPPIGEAPSAGVDATEPRSAEAPGPAPDETERQAAAGPAAGVPAMSAARVRGHAVARKRNPVSSSAASSADAPGSDARGADPEATKPSAASGPAVQKTSRVPASPPSPAATAPEAPVPTLALSRESTPPSTPVTAAATKGVARRSVARVTPPRARAARTPTARTTTESGPATEAPGRDDVGSPRPRLSRVMLGGPTDRQSRAALVSLSPLRVSRRAVRSVEGPVGANAHERSAVSGHASRSRITPVMPGTPRPLVRALARVAGPGTRGTSAAAVASATPAVADTATAPAHISEPESMPSQPFFPLANVPDRPSGQSLARAIGVTRESDGSGRATVVFPPPPGGGIGPGTSSATSSGTSRNARPLARQVNELGTTSLNGRGPEAVQSAAAEPSASDTGEFEALYDRVLSRLRRDLIVERERRGDLAGAYFR